jgi:hypothetical protein
MFEYPSKFTSVKAINLGGYSPQDTLNAWLNIEITARKAKTI